MKSLLLTALAVLCCLISFGQTKDVGSFNAISINSGVTATLVASDQEKVEYDIINGKEENLVIKNKNSELIVKIRNSDGNWNNNLKVEVTIYYKKIYDLEVAHGSKVMCDNEIKVKRFNLEVSSGSLADIMINTEHADMNIAHGSVLDIEGKANEIDVDLAHGSVLKALALNSRSASIKASHGSSAKLKVSKELYGEANHGSSIRYDGSPSVNNVDSDNSSVITKLY